MQYRRLEKQIYDLYLVLTPSVFMAGSLYDRCVVLDPSVFVAGSLYGLYLFLAPSVFMAWSVLRPLCGLGSICLWSVVLLVFI